MGWNPVVPSHTLSEALLPMCGHFSDMMPSIWVVQGPGGLPEAPVRDYVSGIACPGILARKFIFFPELLPVSPSQVILAVTGEWVSFPCRAVFLQSCKVAIHFHPRLA